MARGELSLTIAAPFPDVWEAAQRAVGQLAARFSGNSTTGIIDGQAPGFPASFGQRVRVTIRDLGDGTQVSIRTETVGFQLFDWGQGNRMRRKVQLSLIDQLT